MYDNEDYLYITLDDDLFPADSNEKCGDTSSQIQAG